MQRTSTGRADLSNDHTFMGRCSISLGLMMTIWVADYIGLGLPL